MTSKQNTFIQDKVGLQAFDAIQLDHYKRVQYFLKNGLDPELCDHQQRTLLMGACSLTKEKTALKFSNLLLKYKAKIETSDENGLNSLHYAVLNEHEYVVARFLEFCGNFNIHMQDNEGNTALLLAVLTRNYNIVERIVHCLRKYDLSVDSSNIRGITPLIQATVLNEHEIVKCLINVGRASTEIRDKHFRKSAMDWGKNRDPHVSHEVLKAYSTLYTTGAPCSSRHPLMYHNEPNSNNISTGNPTLKHAILKSPSQYINYPVQITTQSAPKMRTHSRAKQLLSKQTDGACRYPDLKPVYNLYEQELCSSYRKSVPPPRVKTPPVPDSEVSSEGAAYTWRKSILSLKLKQRRHTIALTRSLPNNISTKNLFQQHGLPIAIAGTHARSYSLGTREDIFDPSKWSSLRQNSVRRNSFRYPYQNAPVPATAPEEIGSNHASRRSSISGDSSQKIQRRHSVSFQSLVIGGNDRDIPSQSPRAQNRKSLLKSSVKTGESNYQTFSETQSPILEEDSGRLKDGEEF